MNGDSDLEIDYDSKSRDYYIIWQPVLAIGSVPTRVEALRDLREAAYLGVDTCIDGALLKIEQNEEA
jgi:hypothetical protein